MKLLAVFRQMALMLLPLFWLTAAVSTGEKHEAVMELSNPDRPITVRRGETFAVVVPANQTTGYGWQLAEPPDERVLKLVATEYLSGSSQLDGSGGREVWRFAALHAGRTTVSLKYVRPWEKDRPPANRAVFTIIVP